MLVGVQLQPTGPVGEFNVALTEGCQNGIRVWLFWVLKVCDVGYQVGDGLEGVALGVANEAHWAAFDPAGCIEAVNAFALVVDNSAAVVANHAVFVVEWNTRNLAAEVADCAVNCLKWVVDEHSGV